MKKVLKEIITCIITVIMFFIICGALTLVSSKVQLFILLVALISSIIIAIIGILTFLYFNVRYAFTRWYIRKNTKETKHVIDCSDSTTEGSINSMNIDYDNY